MRYYNETVSLMHLDNPLGIAQTREITFVVTNSCNLKCTYCYETHKGTQFMSFNTAKRIVDYIFELYDQNDPKGFINHNTTALILEFIGGEPFLATNLIYDTCEYFWRKAIKRNHPWAEYFRICITSNGVNYFNPDVQRFIQKFKNRLSLAITIDGNKEMHDTCRKHLDGSGSWTEANNALIDYTKKYNDYLGTKVTIAPENLMYLNQIVRYFSEKGYTEINANPIYEHEWNLQEAKEYYFQLKLLADNILSSQINYTTNIFEEQCFVPAPEYDVQPYCGGSGEMLAFDVDGKAYPCIRYMEMSLNGSQKPYVIGDCFNGIYQTPEHQKLRDEMAAVNRRTMSDDECFYCPIGQGCGCCTAWCYQKYGTMNHRDKNICWMHRARSLANVYYWNKYYQKHNLNKKFKMNLPEDLALQIVDKDEYQMLKELSE